VIAALQNDSAGELLIFTEKGYAKRSLIVDFDLQARGGKGLRVYRPNLKGKTRRNNNCKNQAHACA